MNTLKNYMVTQKENTDVDTFKSLNLSEKEIKILKYSVLSEDVSIPVLINLIMNEKAGKDIKEENKEELEIRKYINEKSEITDIGKEYINSEEVKERLAKLI